MQVAKNTVVESFIPLFDGFYNTMYDIDHILDNYTIEDEVQYLNDDSNIEYNDITIDDIDINYKDYQKDVVESFSNVIENILVENGFISRIENIELVSPRYYNYSNDSINCDYVINDENRTKIANFMLNNIDEFSEELKEKYTPCSGFIPYYSNDIDEWEKDTQNFKFTNDIDGHQFGAVIEFIIKKILIDESGEDYKINLYYDVMDYISSICYLEFSEELYKENRKK